MKKEDFNAISKIVKNENNWFVGFAETRFSKYAQNEKFSWSWSAKLQDGQGVAIAVDEKQCPSTADKYLWADASKVMMVETARDYHGKFGQYICRWSDGVISLHRISMTDLREPEFDESGHIGLNMDDAFLFDDNTFKCLRYPIRQGSEVLDNLLSGHSRKPIEYDNDGMIEMLNQLYSNMEDAIVNYAQEYWYECLDRMDEDDMPEDLEEEFTEWWDNEDTSMLEEDLCQMASELLSEIEGKEVECDDLDEYFQVLDKLGEEVGFAYNFGYLRNILDYGVDLYNDCEIILEN